MDSKFFLGIDGGATKTTAVVINQQKKIVGRGKTAGSNANIHGFAKAKENIKEAIKQALASQGQTKVYACLALAGNKSARDGKNWQEEIKKDKFLWGLFAKPPLIINDTLAALRAGTEEQNAIVIIAGTGSNCYGRNKNGKEAKAGGADFILGDQGSAYQIGLAVLKTVTKSLDGRSNATLLTDLLFRKFKISTLEELEHLVYKKTWDKTDIAQVAPLADEAVKKGDQATVQIIDEAASELAEMAKAVAQKLTILDKKYTIVKSGSVFKIDLVAKLLEEKVRKFSKAARFVKPKMDSATAAAYLAMEFRSLKRKDF